MENLKKILTEAGIISAIVVYSYFVYLVGELGYLNAYGINNAASLVTLELQNVILGFLKAVLYFAVFIVLMVITMLPVFANKGNKKNIRESRRKKIFFFILTAIVAFIGIPYLEDRIGGMFAVIMWVTLIPVLFIVTFIKIPRIKLTLLDLTQKIMDKSLTQKSNESPDTKRMLLLAVAVSMVYVPIVNYIVSYNDVSITSSRLVSIVDMDNSKYLLIKQYSDKNVLIKINDNNIVPTYIIQRGDQLDKTKYSIENRDVNNNSLFPKSQTLLRLNEAIRNKF